MSKSRDKKFKEQLERQKIQSKPVVSPTAKTEEQKEYLKSIRDNEITIAYGLAGCGKTYLPTLQGIHDVLKGKYKRLVLSRPCVEAYGESLGYLPGDYNEKIYPYMMPILDVLNASYGKQDIIKYIEMGLIQTIPLAFMRGLTLSDSFVILDEAQNTLPQQFRLFLTRIGMNSKVVITGDTNQSDIKSRNGLQDAIDLLAGIDNIGIVKLTSKSIIRNPIIEKIEDKYLSRTKLDI